MRRMTIILAIVISLFSVGFAAYGDSPLGSAFTYQGQLKESDVAVTGSYDLQFYLWNHATDTGVPALVAGPICVDDVDVSNGLFTVQIEFGVSPFAGAARWLEVGVREDSTANNCGAGAYTMLSPRQPLTAVPYALYALSGPGVSPWQVSGTDIFNTNSGNVGIGTNIPAFKLDVNGDVRVRGRLGAGSDASFPNGGMFDFSHTYTDFSASSQFLATRSYMTLDPYVDLTGANSKWAYCSDQFTIVPPWNGHDFTGVFGPYLAASMGGTGHVEYLGGAIVNTETRNGSAEVQSGLEVYSYAWINGSIARNTGLYVATGNDIGSNGSIGTNSGILIATPYDAQPIGTNYGLFIADQIVADDDNYAIYSAGGQSYFADNVGIGNPTPTSALDINGDVRATGRVAFGNAGIFGAGPSPWDYSRLFHFAEHITDFSSTIFDNLYQIDTLVEVDPSMDLTGANVKYIASLSYGPFTPAGNAYDIDGIQGAGGGAYHLGSGNISWMPGLVAQAWLEGAGSADDTFGLIAQSIIAGSGSTAAIARARGIKIDVGAEGPASTIADSRGLYVSTPYAVGTITNHYGIYLDDQDVGVSDSYAIYSAGGQCYFNDDVEVTGTLSKGAGSFKIDHPLDPANKYLYHSFVESPDMMNVYNGNVTTDDQGRATVTLPDWFQALNRDFRYQLTVIGQFAQAMVAEEIHDNQFTIRTDKPVVKVSWQVTGIRHDRYAETHRIPVEQVKPQSERGLYLHAEAHGQPRDREVGRRNAVTGSAHHGIEPRTGRPRSAPSTSLSPNGTRSD